MYALIASLNIIVCICVCKMILRTSENRPKPIGRTLLYLAAELPRFMVLVLTAIIRLIPMIIMRFLPHSARARLSFACRYVTKAGQALEEQSEIQLQTIRHKSKKEPEQHQYVAKGVGRPNRLTEFLGIYDILILVLKNLHYTDIATLSLVSRSVREILVPTGAHAQRILHLQMYTCRRRAKAQCWSCTNQICTVSTSIHLALFTTPLHM